jgi:hypothetical protein
MKTPQILTLSARGPCRRTLCAGAIVASLAFAGPCLAQEHFTAPETAAETLIKAVSDRDQAEMAKVLGKDWHALLPTEGVSEADRQAFLDRAAEARSIVKKEGGTWLQVGKDEWVLPIPLAQAKDGKWYFDPKGGREAILEHRIGLNELSVMQAMLAYLDAQREYATQDRNGDGVLEYAQKLVSTPGTRDGLIWPESMGDESPLGEAFVPPPGAGYHGYRFRILTAQGPHAKGGASNNMIGKHLATGFGLLAWPVKYGDTGVMTFIVNQEGQIYQQDFGPGTTKSAEAIKRYDPGPGWEKTQP